ncbi:3-oxoacyl-ACP reductase [Xylanimonas oleitrophica]|uniref:3-oxoacyl-ACP reductase n=1 Tax=Xylanimonas oleitrophica TaxID=2607479 RepID=A0A2W5WX48_9MICO|nr:3-oxoacyl-ACP reductase [Xylanimonas oleitrophica]
MGDDDDRDCVEHVWVLDGAYMRAGRSTLEYGCSRCGAVSVRPANWSGRGGE